MSNQVLPKLQTALKRSYQLHRRIPLVRRPFFQRDQAIAERDKLAAQLRLATDELAIVKVQRDRIAEDAMQEHAEMTARLNALECGHLPSCANDTAREANSELQIIVTRGDQSWPIPPAAFETFAFHHGDQLHVSPPELAAGFPVTWGDTNIPVAPGRAIRVPARYEFFPFKGFDIPSHLISLTGAGPETLDAIGRRHIELYDKFCGIQKDMTVLDIGCGIGRDAFQLFGTLSPDKGRYIGVDVTRDSIVWCQNNITPRYPNFQFHHLDAENELYNPHGKYTSSDFRLPVESASVDRIFLASVFTHLLEEEVLHYMKEFARVLKPDGQVYASFFLRTAEALEAAKSNGTTAWAARFDISLSDGVYANDPTYPRGAVAFTDAAMQRLMGEADLRLVRPYLKGAWSGLHAEADDGQDVAILARANSGLGT